LSLQQLKDKTSALKSQKKISTVQSILENQDFEDVDAYGLGSVARENREYSTEPASRQSLESLSIYRTENILSIVADRRRKEEQDQE